MTYFDKLLKEAKQAYEFSPNSYTNSLMHAVMRLMEAEPGDQILALLENTGPEERVAAFAKVTNRFCEHCWHAHPEGATCQCWNDE